MAKIAIIPIKGTIVSEKSRRSGMKTTSSLEIVPLLMEIGRNKAIKALVLEINSPGGTPFSCEEIAQSIKSVNKPTVAWVREMAASGGYWIATAADSIVASPLSTVGSVGVISIRPNVSELLEKIGIDVDAVASGVHKTLGLPFKPLSPEEKQEDRQRREGEIRIIQQSFIREIQGKRKITEEVLKEISSGKTYLGQEARDLGLVDELGGKEKALEIAAKKANVTKYKVIDFTNQLEKPRRGLLSRLFLPFLPWE